MRHHSLSLSVSLGALCLLTLTRCDAPPAATPPADPPPVVAAPSTAVEALSVESQAALDACFKARDMDACDALKLARLSEARAGFSDEALGRQSWIRAHKLLKWLCLNQKRPQSCVELGDASLAGEGRRANELGAAIMYKNACDRLYDPGCVKLGAMHTQGKALGVKPEQTVIDAEEAACDAGKANACARLASRYQSGFGATKDLARASTYYERSCAMKYPLACHAVAVGLMKSGKDDARALTLFEQACDADFAQSCYNAAYLLAASRGRPNNPKDVMAKLSKSCTLKYKPACQMKASLQKKKP